MSLASAYPGQPDQHGSFEVGGGWWATKCCDHNRDKLTIAVPSLVLNPDHQAATAATAKSLDARATIGERNKISQNSLCSYEDFKFTNVNNMPSSKLT